MRLTDTHLVLLSTASQHEAGLLPRPDKLGGIVLNRLAEALIKAGMAEPVPVRADQPSWRKDEGDALIGLRITPVGLTAIGVDHARTGNDTPSDQVDDGAAAEVPVEATRVGLGESADCAAFAKPPRSGTKLALLRTLLAAPEGAPIDTLVNALGWQAHTVRAALTRLRQGGLAITASKDPQGRTVYRADVGVSGTKATGGAEGEAA